MPNATKPMGRPRKDLDPGDVAPPEALDEERRDPKRANGLLCAAYSRSSGRPCRMLALGGSAGNGRCRQHGGRSPTGVRNYNFSSGRYSKMIPPRLLERYNTAQRDANLLSMREEISLLDARLGDVLARVDTGEGGVLWQSARNFMRSYRKAVRANDPDTAKEAMIGLEETLTKGLADYATWNDVRNLIQERRKLVESERKRMIELQQTITSEQAMAFVAAVVSSVKRNVTDPNVLELVSRDIALLIGRRELPNGRTIQGQARVVDDEEEDEVEDE